MKDEGREAVKKKGAGRRSGRGKEKSTAAGPGGGGRLITGERASEKTLPPDGAIAGRSETAEYAPPSSAGKNSAAGAAAARLLRYVELCFLFPPPPLRPYKAPLFFPLSSSPEAGRDQDPFTELGVPLTFFRPPCPSSASW